MTALFINFSIDDFFQIFLFFLIDENLHSLLKTVKVHLAPFQQGNRRSTADVYKQINFFFKLVGNQGKFCKLINSTMHLRNFILKPTNYNIKLLRKCHSNEIDAGIKIFSCVKKKKIPLVLRSNSVYSSFYTCGPTTYDSAHIGHASTYVRLDIIQRILKNYFNINLVSAMNITNIDDKIIKRSQELQKDWKILAADYEQEFWEDLKSLNVQLPDIRIRVTDKLPEIIKFVEKILETGKAYKAEDGSVYFRTDSYKNYGKLQNVVLESKEHGVKENVSDFALWKAAKAGEPFWEASFGKGRPGWHIECSAMASLLFGKQIDFHAGGVDLR